ncbi:uncharacterized protein TNCV_5131301 [Trichonephila clavipes]|nr:uncharacterized protein TNCV_5131301 [Trichonephila clavipes]
MGHERKRRQKKRKFHGNFRTAKKKVSEGSISSEKLGRGLSDTLFNVDTKLFLKRVGSRLRKLKKSTKGLDGKGKLTDKFIDTLQNYFGIAMRSNVGNLSNMQTAVIAAFFHCCSTDKKPMHGQCPSGSDTWCKYQKAKQEGKLYKHRTAGLPNAVLNTVKTTYMDLCDQSLLEKCLHGKTQNANESFNGVLWSIIPKETFVELLTLQFGAFLAVLQFNDGSKGILSMLEYLHIPMGYFFLKGFSKVDDERIVDSERHSLPTTKNKRKNSEDLKKELCII